MALATLGPPCGGGGGGGGVCVCGDWGARWGARIQTPTQTRPVCACGGWLSEWELVSGLHTHTSRMRMHHRGGAGLEGGNLQVEPSIDLGIACVCLPGGSWEWEFKVRTEFGLGGYIHATSPLGMRAAGGRAGGIRIWMRSSLPRAIIGCTRQPGPRRLALLLTIIINHYYSPLLLTTIIINH